ncbi:MAG: hypothetical protein HDR19_07465 [Lachnospiraceae bacterium]|nr:hypothetical protein [Lachnospiraceae bacterium]
MKNSISKVIVCLAVFILTLFVSSSIYNKGNEEMTANMTQASLPMVHITTGGNPHNYMYGLRQVINGSFFRDTITPLGDGRTLGFTIDKYGNSIDKISFEVRSIDGERLVESTPVENYAEDADQITATVTIKDLIESDVEYNWILMLETGGEEIRYYTRIIDGTEYHTAQKLAFVKDFHEKTFDKERAKDLAMYLEPNAKGDNTTLSFVDIHCSLNQVTWADLNVKEITSPQMMISEIDQSTASIKLYYRVQTSGNGSWNREIATYNIVEFFRIRYTEDRIYLLDYERSMNRIFDPEADVYASNKIMLGIRNSNVEMMESDGGSNLAFINENQLLCYHSVDKKMAYLFSFYDGNDLRSSYDNHSIKILNVDETGNVMFIVYGYMNRGRHEGSIGVEIYEYNGMLNTVEELMFIPYDKSFATLKTDVDQLSYINKSGVFYIYLDGEILAVSLIERTSSVVADNLQQGSFQVSASNKMLVWQNSEDAYDCTRLITMDLNTGDRGEIRATGSDRLLPLGFINEDLIYGVARYDDIDMDVSGAVIFLMYAVYIQDERGNILKTYEHESDGLYVTGATIADNLITLTRVVKDEETGSYTESDPDQIVNNVVEDNGYNSSEVVATQNYENIVQLVLKNVIEPKKLKHTLPLLLMFEGSREMKIEIEHPINRYYVYGKYGIDGTFTHEADAINLAYAINGTVVDENGDYIWKKTSRSTRNQIMAITGKTVEEDSTELAACLETILEFEGVVKNVQPLLDRGKSVTQILEENLNDTRALELRGVSLDAVLYYVNKDIPVLVNFEDGRAMLLIGFNELNVVVMNPATGTVYKIGMNDATNMFLQNRNAFVTYIRK